jgi:hypothetical protein
MSDGAVIIMQSIGGKEHGKERNNSKWNGI